IARLGGEAHGAHIGSARALLPVAEGQVRAGLEGRARGGGADALRAQLVAVDEVGCVACDVIGSQMPPTGLEFHRLRKSRETETGRAFACIARLQISTLSDPAERIPHYRD